MPVSYSMWQVILAITRILKFQLTPNIVKVHKRFSWLSIKVKTIKHVVVKDIQYLIYRHIITYYTVRISKYIHLVINTNPTFALCNN